MKRLIFLSLCMVLFFPSIAQKNFFVEAGAGVPEGFNLGPGYRYTPVTSVSLKYAPVFNLYGGGISHIVTLNNAFYFGKIHEKVNRKLWSFNIGLTTAIINNDHKKGYEMVLSGCFAREFAITEKIFIRPELGGFQTINKHIEAKDGDIGGDVILLPVYPKIGLSFIFDI